MARVGRAAAAAYVSDTAFHTGLLLGFGLVAMAVSLAFQPAAALLANQG